MKIIFSQKCLEYSHSSNLDSSERIIHLESPERVGMAYGFLKGEGYEFLEPKPATEEDLLRVHSEQWMERIKKRDFIDLDTPAYENIYRYASLSAGGAIMAAKEKGFSLMRPPGHHAGRNGRALGAPTLGFCYFNNIAVAVRHLDQPTLILDIDGHHGNGTQEIFSGDRKVTYVSLHVSPQYPNTGFESKDNYINFPLPSNSGDEKYLKTLDDALRRVDLNKIDLVAISAGFDAHQGDLASLGLTSTCYRGIGERVKALKRPTFAVLEGGYGKNVGRYIHQLIKGLEYRPSMASP
jgi:acetoin utilization deacetylase AcuC-like enzyme